MCLCGKAQGPTFAAGPSLQYHAGITDMAMLSSEYPDNISEAASVSPVGCSGVTWLSLQDTLFTGSLISQGSSLWPESNPTETKAATHPNEALPSLQTPSASLDTYCAILFQAGKCEEALNFVSPPRDSHQPEVALGMDSCY